MLAALFCLNAGAQDQSHSQHPKPTLIVDHHTIGETFDEWLRTSGQTMDAICSDSPVGCVMLRKIQRTGDGVYQSLLGGHISVWTFAKGKVAMVFTNYREPEIQQQRGFLLDAYGPPSMDRIETYQNALGAKFDCREQTWNMPDGTIVSANEEINLEYTPPRILKVAFTSKEYLDSVSAKPKNPYK